jgi:phosphatidylglycerophosphate synthase
MTNFHWRLPAAPLRSSALRAVTLGLVVTLVLSPIVASWTMSGADYIKRCLLFFAAPAILVVGLVGAHHPFPRFGSANVVTMLRVALVAGVAGLIGELPSERIEWLAVVTVAILAVLDGVDGWLARRSSQASAFGARFDMETDAGLILVLSILVWQHEKAGAWVLLCGLMRYGFVAAGWRRPWLAQPLPSTRRGKTVAVGQLFGLSVALAPIVPPPLSAIAGALALAALAWSFAIDIHRLSRQYRDAQEQSCLF